jgi:hypothetical protein
MCLKWQRRSKVPPNARCVSYGSALPFQTRLTQTKLILPLSNEHSSQVKDQDRRQCCHTKHKKFPYRPTRGVSLVSGHGGSLFLKRIRTHHTFLSAFCTTANFVCIIWIHFTSITWFFMWNSFTCLESWTEHFVVSLWSNQQMRLSSTMIYWYVPNLPQHVSAIHRQHQGVVLPQKLLKQYLCCGVWITVSSVASCRGIRPLGFRYYDPLMMAMNC